MFIYSFLGAYDTKNKSFQKFTHLKGFSKYTNMAFFFL